MSFLEIWGSFCSNDFEWRGMFRVIGDYKPTQTLAIFKISEQNHHTGEPWLSLVWKKKAVLMFSEGRKPAVHCETKETRILASKPSPWTLPGCIRVCFFRQKYTFPSSEQVFFCLCHHISLWRCRRNFLSCDRLFSISDWSSYWLIHPFYLNHFEWVC